MKFLNFLRTGYYNRSIGYVYGRVPDGNWWSFAAGSGVSGHILNTYPASVNPQLSNYRGKGFAIRCIVREG